MVNHRSSRSGRNTRCLAGGSSRRPFHSPGCRIDPNEPHPDQVWTRDGDCTTEGSSPSQPVPFFVSTDHRLDGTSGRTVKIPIQSPSPERSTPSSSEGDADNRGLKALGRSPVPDLTGLCHRRERARGIRGSHHGPTADPLPCSLSWGDLRLPLGGLPFSATTSGHHRGSWCQRAKVVPESEGMSRTGWNRGPSIRDQGSEGRP